MKNNFIDNCYYHLLKFQTNTQDQLVAYQLYIYNYIKN